MELKYYPGRLKRLSALLLLIIALLKCVYATASGGPFARTDDSASLFSPEACFENAQGILNAYFETHLPLIILEGRPETPGGGNTLLRIIDSGGANMPDIMPSYSGDAFFSPIRYEGESSREKEDYTFSLLREDGGEARVSLLGLAPGANWVLLGGMYDKSLLRNYIGYTLLSKTMEKAPGIRFCEVLLKDGQRYQYQGVYLLVEASIADEATVLRRTEERWEQEGQTMVSNGFMGAFVLQGFTGDVNHLADISQTFDRLDAMFSSGDTNFFLQYQTILDVDSFIGSFLVNEMMANYAEALTGSYTYDPSDGRLSTGPLWNFERSLDNRREEAMNPGRLAFQNTPFYEHMVWDGAFLNDLLSASKRNAIPINSNELQTLIDETVIILGAAQQRDWYRWQDVYFAPENALEPYIHPDAAEDEEESSPSADTREPQAKRTPGEVREIEIELKEPAGELPKEAPARIRQCETYEQETMKLKYLLRLRIPNVREALPFLTQQENRLGKENAYSQNTWHAVVFFVVFALTIFFSRKVSING